MAEPTAQIEAEIDALLLLQARGGGSELEPAPWSSDPPAPTPALPPWPPSTPPPPAPSPSSPSDLPAA